VGLIYSFLRRQELEQVAKVEAIGGTVSKNSLRNIIGSALEDTYEGAVAWLCRNNDHIPVPGFPSLFLAFESAQYDTRNVPAMPEDDELITPRNIFKFEGSITETAIKKWLSEHTIDESGKEDGAISKTQVLKLINKMPNDPLASPYNRYACGFFETRSSNSVRDFLNTDGLEAVRYYFGFEDRDASHVLSNRIRLIFVGVDGAGKNIMPRDGANILSYSLLQNSWPPPPPY